MSRSDLRFEKLPLVALGRMNGKSRRGFGWGGAGKDGERTAEKNLIGGPVTAGDESQVAVKGEGEARGQDDPLVSVATGWTMVSENDGCGGEVASPF